jgi:acyl-CoA thioester hydrolase
VILLIQVVFEQTLRLLVASIRIDYLAEAHYPEMIDVGLATLTIGLKSWTVASAAFQKDLCVAVNDTVVVFSDGQRPIAIPEQIRGILENLSGRRDAAGESANTDTPKLSRERFRS